MNESEREILEKVNQYNLLMNKAIKSPNCTDPTICYADCCHIMIDVPKFLAQYFIKNGLAKKNDFYRGNLFSFKIKVTPANSKCVFYDRELNGCSLHSTMHKPPQCWVYPTGFSNEPGEEKCIADDGTIKCKKASGWKITDESETQKAKSIFEDYVSYCKKEFVQENTRESIKERLEPLFVQLSSYSPKSIAGVIDGWDQFSILKSEGISLKLKSLCDQILDHKCNCDYIECKQICKEIRDLLHRDLLDQIMNFIQTEGAKGEYSFFELWNL